MNDLEEISFTIQTRRHSLTTRDHPLGDSTRSDSNVIARWLQVGLKPTWITLIFQRSKIQIPNGQNLFLHQHGFKTLGPIH